MLRLTLAGIAVAALALFSVPARAQTATYTLPEFGLQSGGPCPQLAVRDRSSKSMVPLGCLDAPSKTWSLTPNSLKMQQTGAPSVTDLFTTPPETGTYASGRGAEFSICPWIGCPTNPPQEVLRAQQYIRFKSKMGGEVGETALALDSFFATGHTDDWKASTAYAIGARVMSGTSIYGNGNIYEATKAGTSATSPGPNGTGASISDGTVIWKYVTAAALGDQKVGLSETCVAGVEAGQTWCGARNLIVLPGAKGKHFSASEIDFGNLAKDCTSDVANCYATFYYGITRYPITAWQLFSTPPLTPEIGSPPNWAPNTAYAIDGNKGAPVRKNGARYYVLTGNGTSAASGGPSGTGDVIQDGTATWAYYNAAFPVGVTGGATHYGLLFQGLNNVQNSTILDGTNSQIVLEGDPISTHQVAFIRDRSRAPSSYLAQGANTYATINDQSTSPFGILQEGNYANAAYKYRNAVIGNWSGDAAYTALSLNGSLVAAGMNGFFGSVADPVLHANASGSYDFRVGNTPALAVDGTRVTAANRYNAPLYTPPSSSSACAVGDFANDANFHYVCVAANTWKRAALSSW